MTAGPSLRTVAMCGREQIYAEYGSPEIDAQHTIVMVHGLRGTWQGLDRIARALTGFRVLIPALPGFGGTPDLAAGDSVHNYAAWLTEFVGALGLTGHVILGHSFGSIIVAEAAATDVRATILVNPVAVAANNGPHPVSARAAEGLYRLAQVLPEKAGNWILRTPIHTRIMSVTMAKTDNPELRRWIHRQHDNFYGSYTTRAGVGEAFSESVHRSVGENAARITTPTLLIAGERDDVATPSDQQRLAHSIANSELVVLPNVGHLIHYEQPGAAAAAIVDFLDRLPK